MARIDEEVFICLDCETTGLDPIKDRIIEVAAVRFTTSEILDTFESLIDPECLIPQASIDIHNITQQMVEGKPKIDAILPDLITFMGGHIIIGHGIQFDIDIVVNAAERHKLPHSLRKNRSLDTLRMARLYGESPVNSLEQLRKHFNIAFEGTHRAMGDALVNLEVFRRLAKFYQSSDQIFAALSRPILFKIMPLGKHKGRPLKDLPQDYLLWAARQEYDQDLLFSLRTEVNRRKQGNSFSTATNPFSNL